ncbi:hypothetical protein J41TS2_17880 [Bacillus sonorensis]|nr:hypothetical protein J41TS2_17880 [Bacillus sonorensis]
MILLLLIGSYLLLGLGTYAYCVFVTYWFLGFWVFGISDECVGICKYPKWLMFWIYWIANKFR